MKGNTSVFALGSKSLESRFSRNVTSAWEDFMVRGDVSKPQVRDVVLKSWQRCRDAQILHEGNSAPLSMAELDLQSLHDKHSNLLRAAFEVSKTLSSTLRDSKSVLMVTDFQGVILESYGDKAVNKSRIESHVYPGACWGERQRGTNAIGTALATGGPVQIHALEHYCEGLREWTCSAALIRGQHKTDILGAVDVSGFDKTLNVHSLALAISISSQIEATLAGWEAHDRIVLLQLCSEKASHWKSDGLIILDNRGCVMSVNQNAQEILRSRGIKVDITRGNRLGEIGVMSSLGASSLQWISEDWIQPVVVNGKKLGMIIVIPQQVSSTRSVLARSADTSSNQGEIRTVVNHAFDRIVRRSEVMCAAIDRAKRFAVVKCPILILGETGVGKEEFAHAIHEASGVSAGPFIPVNCGALAKDLVASELFGYADGSFTGARRGGRAGKFEEANGGTLFLDEIGELPADIQTHLLRVLQDGNVIRVGESRERKVSVRILSATHRDLRTDIAEGRFREDLYYRIALASLTIPPLRARTNDIVPLAEHFLELLFRQYGGRKKCLDDELVEVLRTYSWPGNVREMKNLLESMFHLSDSDVLGANDFPHEFIRETRGSKGTCISEVDAVGNLRSIERDAIVAALMQTQWNMLKAARLLGIARSTLYQKVKSYEISTVS